MTEIGEEQFAAMFGGPPRMTPEQEAHAEQVEKAVHDAQVRAYAQVQFFAPVLCGCTRRYDRDDPHPPQAGCVVHGHLQADDGRVLMFGIPKNW